MYIDLITIDLCPGQGGGGVDPSGTLDITSNGLYNVYSYASASVSVHPSTSLSETYTSNGSYNITGEFNGGLITIEVPAPQFITETLSVSSNGTYIPSVGVNGFSEVVVSVFGGGGYTQEQITERTWNIVNMSNSARYVGARAFTEDSVIETVDLPNCSSVYLSAFAGCTALREVNLSHCFQLQSSAFRGCSSLYEINIPCCMSFTGGSIFENCQSLSSVTLARYTYYIPYYWNGILSNTKIASGTGYIYVDYTNYSRIISMYGWSSFSNQIVSVGESEGPMLSFSDNTLTGKTYFLDYHYSSYVNITINDVHYVSLPNCFRLDEAETGVNRSGIFRNYSNLVGVSIPNCEYVGYEMFYGCKSLSSLEFPVCSSIGQMAMAQCTSLSMINIPNCEYLGYGTLYGCPITELSVKCSYIDEYAFYECRQLNTIFLTGSSVCVLGGSGVFYSTPIGAGNGSIYVTSSLVDAYKSANYWSQYASQIFPIPE